MYLQSLEAVVQFSPTGTTQVLLLTVSVCVSHLFCGAMAKRLSAGWSWSLCCLPGCSEGADPAHYRVEHFSPPCGCGNREGRGASLGIFQGNGCGCNASACIFSLSSAPFFFMVPCGSLAEGTVSHCLFLLLFSSFLIASSLGLLPNSLL